MKGFGFLAVAGILSAIAACAGGGAGERREIARDTVSRSIEEVLEVHTQEWMKLPGVVGTGIGECEGEPCIKVFLASETPEVRKAIPESVGGYRVGVEVTGPFRALDPNSG